MIKYYIFLKLPLLIACMVFNGLLQGQTIEYLNSNNINAGIGTGGNLFTRADSGGVNTSWDLFEVPKGSGKTEIFTAALWMCAQDSEGNEFGAANSYFEYGVDYFDGPISINYNSDYDTFYHRIFKITKTQLNQFRNLTFPALPSQVDSAILYWPGNGNPSVLSDYRVNISGTLAPFIDINNNGIYEPLLGDYPSFSGDQAIFFVFNDARGYHSESNGTALGVEIRGMAISFANTNTCVALNGKNALNNTVFVQYQIENKSQKNYLNYTLGLFTDPDVGCPENDFVGCDSLRNLMFAYNGTPTDVSCDNVMGYDSLPIALGVRWLNQNMDAFGIYTGNGAPNPALPLPTTSAQYCNQLHGLWGDGPPFKYGGNGYSDSTAGITKFLYSGDPNDSTQWSEVQCNDVPGERKMYGASGPVNFNSGEIKRYDFAFLTTYDITSNHIAIVDTLKLASDYINSFYNNCLVPEQVSGIFQPNTYQSHVSIYPNPASDYTFISSSDNIKSFDLTDIQGRILFTQNVSAQTFKVNVSGLAKGVYLVNIQCDEGAVIKRIVVE